MPEDPIKEKPAHLLPAWSLALVVLAVAAGIFVMFSGNWNRWESDRAEQSTDDAYVKADTTNVGTKATGVLAHLNVADYQHVDPGQVIASIRDEDYQTQVDAAQAGLRAAEAGLPELAQQQAAADSKILQAMAAVDAADSQIVASQAGVTAAEASVHVAEAELSSAAATFENAMQESERQEALYPEKATTLQKLQNQRALTTSARAARDARQLGVEASHAQLGIRQADLARARSALAGSKADVSVAESSRRLLSAKALEIQADILARRAALESAKISAGYTVIVAPAAGYVASRNVLPGQIVTPGTTVVSLVEQTPWIQANFKETQLTHVRAGDTAQIHVDMFPGHLWRGRVLAVAPATGSQTALIGPDNATGNFTKIVQRLPVKISLDADQDLTSLRPGMSATVMIRQNKGA